MSEFTLVWTCIWTFYDYLFLFLFEINESCFEISNKMFVNSHLEFFLLMLQWAESLWIISWNKHHINSPHEQHSNHTRSHWKSWMKEPRPSPWLKLRLQTSGDTFTKSSLSSLTQSAVLPAASPVLHTSQLRTGLLQAPTGRDVFPPRVCLSPSGHHHSSSSSSSAAAFRNNVWSLIHTHTHTHRWKQSSV